MYTYYIYRILFKVFPVMLQVNINRSEENAASTFEA